VDPILNPYFSLRKYELLIKIIRLRTHDEEVYLISAAKCDELMYPCSIVSGILTIAQKNRKATIAPLSLYESTADQFFLDGVKKKMEARVL